MKQPVVPNNKALRLTLIALVFILTISFTILDNEDYMLVLWGAYGVFVLGQVYKIYYAYKQHLKSFIYMSLGKIFVLGALFAVLHIFITTKP